MSTNSPLLQEIFSTAFFIVFRHFIQKGAVIFYEFFIDDTVAKLLIFVSKDDIIILAVSFMDDAEFICNRLEF